MTILIVGADGMIGYGLWSYFRHKTARQVMGSIRSKRDLWAFGENWRANVTVTGDIENDAALEILFANCEPTLVVNCAGATMHAANGSSPLAAIQANSLLPHRLHGLAVKYNARFVHLSTDCVYDGERGGYRETEPPNATTLYGRTKAIGEIVDADNALTLRTSPIGYELSSRRGLLAWFLHQQGRIRGFTNAYFTGLTNLQLAEAIDKIFVGRPDLHGLFHVTGPRISKFELLSKCRDAFGSDVIIEPDGGLVRDRSLDSSKLSAATGYKSPSWDKMLADLADFAQFYPSRTATRGRRHSSRVDEQGQIHE
jgi:dTDP-4-dehydrorhamnose reductase